MDKTKVNLSNSEWRIMQVLWDKGTCTLRDLMAELQYTGWEQHVVLTLLKRMTDKGTVHSMTNRRPGKYSSLIEKDEALQMETANLLKRVYNDDLMSMVSYAIQSRDLSDADIAELKGLLEEKK